MSLLLIIVSFSVLTFIVFDVFGYSIEQIDEVEPWIRFDIGDHRTYPREGDEVLCYIDAFKTYHVCNMTFDDDGKLTWRLDADDLQLCYYPTYWQKINKVEL